MENFLSPPTVTKLTPKPEETFDREKEIEESREASKRVSRLIGGASAVKRRAPPKKKAPAKKPKKVEKSEGVEAILEGLQAFLKERKRKKKKEK